MAQLIDNLLLGGITASLEQLFYIQEGTEELVANLAGIGCSAIQVGCCDVQQGLQVALQRWPLCLKRRLHKQYVSGKFQQSARR